MSITISGDGDINATGNDIELNSTGTTDVTLALGGGSVGIGTATPSAPLHVAADSNTLSLRISGRSSDDRSDVEFYENDNTTKLTGFTNEPGYSLWSYGTRSIYTDSDAHIFRNGSATTLARLDSDGLKFNGDTAAANALDDFETGTFAPTIVGDSTAGTTTYAQQYGYYTKVGNQVSIVIQLNYTSLTGTGLLKIGGLPFTSANNTQNYAPMSALLSNLNWSAGTQVVALQFQNTSNIYLYGAADDALATPLSCVNEAAEVRISGTYLTS